MQSYKLLNSISDKWSLIDYALRSDIIQLITVIHSQILSELLTVIHSQILSELLTIKRITVGSNNNESKMYVFLVQILLLGGSGCVHTSCFQLT